jgi:hypothetical protein
MINPKSASVGQFLGYIGTNCLLDLRDFIVGYIGGLDITDVESKLPLHDLKASLCKILTMSNLVTVKSPRTLLI